MQLSGGQVHDVVIALDLIGNVNVENSVVMADKAYVSTAFRTKIEESGATYCIPYKENATEPWEVDWWQYKERHLVECFFQKIKQYRRIATRYEKLAIRFLAMVHLAFIMIWLK